MTEGSTPWMNENSLMQNQNSVSISTQNPHNLQSSQMVGYPAELTMAERRKMNKTQAYAHEDQYHLTRDSIYEAEGEGSSIQRS